MNWSKARKYKLPKLQRHLIILVLAAIALVPLWLLEGSSRRQEVDDPLAVQFSHPTGFYEDDIRLEMEVAEPEAMIQFTTDGSLPTPTNGSVYQEPLRLSADPESVVVVRARAIDENGILGPEANMTYFLGFETAMPVVSLMVEPDDLWDWERGIFIRPDEKGPEWERPAELVYLDDSKQIGFSAPAGIRIHGGASRWAEKKSIRLYFRPEYGLAELDYPLFPDSGQTRFKRLVLHAGGQDQPTETGNGTLLRNPLISALAQETDVIVAEGQPVLLFINGQPWGIYNLRERLDRIYFADRFGIGDLDILGPIAYAPEPLEGNWTHWDELMSFVEANDMADPENYTTVISQIDVENFIDYYALQYFIGNADWPQRSHDRFYPYVQGGKWHWFLWDGDFAFGLAFEGGELPDPITWLLTGEEGGSARLQAAWQDSLLFRKLMDNPDFKLAFIRRLEGLLNTAFLPEAVIAQLDALASQVEPDIEYETLRWQSSGNWSESVEQMRNFARQRPDLIRQNVVEELGLSGTVELDFEAPRGKGSVDVNGFSVPELPWSGLFFTGLPIEITALPESGYRFAGWEPAELPQTETITLSDSFPRQIRPLFERRRAGAPQRGDVVIQDVGIDQDGLGDWIELEVARPSGVDLRGWRLTDNDDLITDDEGSLLFGQQQALVGIPPGTGILIVASETGLNNLRLPEDDLQLRDGRLVFYAGNDHVQLGPDRWFNLMDGETIMLLAPGATDSPTDDEVIDIFP